LETKVVIFFRLQFFSQDKLGYLVLKIYNSLFIAEDPRDYSVSREIDTNNGVTAVLSCVESKGEVLRRN